MAKINFRVALFLGNFGGGGIERVTARLSHQLVKLGIQIDLILIDVDSTHLWQMPSESRIINLKSSGLFKSLPKLVRYLRQERPSILFAADHFANEVAILACSIARVPTRVIVSERNQLSKTARNGSQLKARLAPLLTKLLYPLADGILAVSHGVAKDLAHVASLPLEKIEVIYNPVNPEMFVKAKEPLDHPWFAPGELPVILGVGKLEKQKDFPTLIRAFAKVQQHKPCRLVILGWGPDRPKLEALIQELGLEDVVDLPGHVNNPYMFMARSAVFALSSVWEGLPNVLIEAIALGIPVVSTDCESGPREILAGGKYGYLTPVGDSEALAEGILQVLSGNPKTVDSNWLNQFDAETATQKYLKLFQFIQTKQDHQRLHGLKPDIIMSKVNS
ncbi:glycosyltransferase [Phormidium sp. LEGE 05292]|uniref:glycosyltransferase n=1 Tax=[Phormidium] sp. LEGE 05292 TaxID=767427 RepID=UPI001880C9A0|nr:glycosyltransferase [Phormidium sp. LEGE 05292]MBE9225009.1 glycosyltransferase [Phormidium sp. LEGE 05292]